MIVLDTNVVSEPGRPRPDQRVLDWLDGLRGRPAWITTPTAGELISGALAFHLRTGSLRHVERTRQIVEVEFADRILPFDTAAAQTYGRIKGERQHAGHQINEIDAMIAAICLVHDATLATRNVKDFVALDLKLLNPFEAGA
jgi:predicted nucleic acid-binding protein